MVSLALKTQNQIQSCITLLSVRRWGFPGDSVVKNLPVQEIRVQSPGQEDPLEEELAAHSSVLPGDPMDRGAWRAAVHGVAESRTRLGD